MRKIGVLLPITIALLSGTLLFAKPKEKIFDNSPKQVFDAALQVAREKSYVISYVDEAHMMFTFGTGLSMWADGFNCSATVEPAGEGKSELIIGVQTKDGKVAMGAGGRMADKFFIQVGEELAKDPSQKVEQKSVAAPVEVPDNHAISGIATGKEEGIVTVISVPDGADVLADGDFVGNASAVLKLKPGKHTITVKQPGYLPWSRDLTVTEGSNTKLNANLTKQ